MLKLNDNITDRVCAPKSRVNLTIEQINERSGAHQPLREAQRSKVGWMWGLGAC
jgi:hypothetical protein